MSTDPESRDGNGPYRPTISSICPMSKEQILFDDVDAERIALEAHGDKVAGFLVEPIQVKAGIVVPDENYLGEIRAPRDKHNVLLICDEIQTGIARTGQQ